MKFFLIERNCVVDYDEYDSAVVAAASPKQALAYLKKCYSGVWNGGWADFDVKITEISPDNYTEPTIVISSFNAG